MNKGFTMMEFLVVIFIIGILSSALFFNWRSGEATFALQNSAHRLVQDIREMQEMAMEAREIDCGGGDTGSSFGIQFKRSWTTYYKLFVDCNGNKVFEANDVELRRVYFEKGVEISTLAAPALSPAAAFNILFVPPDPTTYIKGKTLDMEGVVTIYLPDYSDRKKTIRVNTSGMIEIR